VRERMIDMLKRNEAIFVNEVKAELKKMTAA
jgi:hypothetical protein